VPVVDDFDAAIARDGLEPVIVRACVRDGVGGSPTVVVSDGSFTEKERRALPADMGTSHAVFVSVGSSEVSLRFFTAEGELPACGHGTVAALAVLAGRSGVAEYRASLRAGGRAFAGRAVRRPGGVEASFDPGPVTLRKPTTVEQDLVSSLFSRSAGPAVVASVGRPRVLVPIPTRTDLDAFTPDLDRVREACDRLGLLGCYLYTLPSADGHLAARMFAPSIGVPEDIANANSTACLAAHLSSDGFSTITVDMGDSLGSPSTIIAGAGLDRLGVEVGGVAIVAGGSRS
jgi:trans-2,3-dihydro-3-hydroxyanthranilate isomerase